MTEMGLWSVVYRILNVLVSAAAVNGEGVSYTKGRPR